MEQHECRYCGIEIDRSDRDLPEGVIRLGESLAHESCVFVKDSDLPSDSTYTIAERQYQEARARGPIDAG